MIKFLIHKYDFLHAGFQIDEGWYATNQQNYFIRSYGANLGGHAVCLVGYSKDGAYIANSWSSNWGSRGFAILPWSIFKR